MKGYMQLEDGTVLEGKAFGARRRVVSQMYFYTEMAGCEYLLQDPANAGKAMVMTYPLPGFREFSTEPFFKGAAPSALIVKDYSDLKNRGRKTLADYLEENNIFGLSYVDTRFLAKKIRSHGSMKCLLATGPSPLGAEALKEIMGETEKNTSEDYLKLSSVPSHMAYKQGFEKTIAILDLGSKHLLLKSLAPFNINIHIFPYNTDPQEILALNPSWVFVTNGGGEPEDYPSIGSNIKTLAARTKVYAIGLGALLGALACGASLEKLNNGCRGANYPIFDYKTGKINIMSKNIGYGLQRPKDWDLNWNFRVRYESVNQNRAIEGFVIDCLGGERTEQAGLEGILFSPEGSEVFKKILGELPGGMFSAKI